MTYSKELWAITESVHKWRHYLLGTTFIIHTDHRSLKNLLAQSIKSPEQQYFLTWLFGFSFSIEYKRGQENLAADALSQLLEMTEDGLGHLALFSSSPMFVWVAKIKREHLSNPWVVSVKAKVWTEGFDLDCTITGGIPYFRYWFCIGLVSELRH